MDLKLRSATLGLIFALALGCSARARLTAPAEPAGSAPAFPSPIVDFLAAKRPRVTDEQLAKLRELPLEACWAALQGLGYRRSFEGGFIVTQPGKKVSGRAVTMRYLPVRPDLVDAAKELAAKGGWNQAFNIRAGDVLERGDLVCVELGGMVERATFVGDITALAIQERGASAMVVDGGIRDFDEIRRMEIPCYVRGTHASAMEDQIGVEWGVPVRIGGITVLSGDAVLGDAEGILAIPPQLVDQVIEKAESTVEKEEFIREKIRSGKHRASDLYPTPSPELMKELEARKAKRAPGAKQAKKEN
jgi:regulator of RNase E activity RraA